MTPDPFYGFIVDLGFHTLNSRVNVYKNQVG